MEAALLKYPDLFNIVFFKVRAKLVKMGKISKVKNLTGWPKMKQTGFLARATVGTSLYVSLSQLVS